MMSVPLNRPGRSITRMRSTRTARPVTSRFTVRARALFSSADENSEEFPLSGGRPRPLARTSDMNSTALKPLQLLSAALLGLMLTPGIALAQTPNPSPTPADHGPTSATTGADAGNYLVTSSIEFG